MQARKYLGLIDISCKIILGKQLLGVFRGDWRASLELWSKHASQVTQNAEIKNSIFQFSLAQRAFANLFRPEQKSAINCTVYSAKVSK